MVAKIASKVIANLVCVLYGKSESIFYERDALPCDLKYVDMNMVRAGAVAHPSQWLWCGYQETAGLRKRYRLIDREKGTYILREKGLKYA